MQWKIFSRRRILAPALLVAVSALLLLGAAQASAAATPAITFVSPPSPAEGATLTTNSVSFEFTYNRKPKATRRLVCALSGPTSSSGPCDAPTAFGADGSQSGASYSCLADGSYTLSVALSLTDSGTASATRHFTVAVVSGHVYWANNGMGTIGRANLDGTGACQSFITGASEPRGVAVDAGHVYWANLFAGTIGRANLDGTGANQSFITGASGPFMVAVDSNYVYWANFSTGTIGRANLDGTGANQSFISGASQPFGVAVDAD